MKSQWFSFRCCYTLKSNRSERGLAIDTIEKVDARTPLEFRMRKFCIYIIKLYVYSKHFIRSSIFIQITTIKIQIFVQLFHIWNCYGGRQLCLLYIHKKPCIKLFCKNWHIIGSYRLPSKLMTNTREQPPGIWSKNCNILAY